MLAAAIGIDGAIEADIGRLVARDHLSRGIDFHGGLERRQLIEALPAIVEGDARLGLVTAAGIGLRAAPAPPLAIDRDRKLGERRVEGRAPAGSEGAVTGGCLRA